MLEVAVIAVPDERWCEIPAAYVTVQEGRSVTEEEIVAQVRERLVRLKAPTKVAFGELPKTSTAKIQNFVLREKACEGAER